MNLLKRELAPITPRAWEAIETEARRALQGELTARGLVDIDGPHGWEKGCVNTGRLEKLEEPLLGDVPAGVRKCLPLAEIRVPVRLRTMVLDSIERGGDLDLDPVARAAERIAAVENHAIFSGFASLGIEGIVSAAAARETSLSGSGSFPRAVSGARERLQEAGVVGPYALALGPKEFQDLSRADEGGYPVQKHIARLIEGPIARVSGLAGGVLLSRRGGDHVLTIGQDVSIGYVTHDRDEVELYLTESFTFQVRDEGAAVVLARG